MTLAFYKVNNSLNYERDTFDFRDDYEILEMLNELPLDEWVSYNLDYRERGCNGAREFENDYNDEILDGGWWCVILDA